MAITELPHDFKELFECLNSERVEYLLVGGWAVAAYAVPRFTQALDVWVDIGRENSERIVRALRRFGFSSEAVSVDLFLSPLKVTRFGAPPLQVDILTSIAGVKFIDCYPERCNLRIQDVVVPVISRKRLIENKQASGRHKDLADVESLLEGRAG